MSNATSGLNSVFMADPDPRGSGILRWLREQISYFRSMRELNALDDRTLEDIGISRGQFSTLARRHARGLPPIDRAVTR